MKKIMIFCVVAFLFVGCESKPVKVATPSPEGSAADQKVMSFSLSGYEKNGKKKWEVEGKSADIMTEVVNLTDVVAKAYGEETDMTIIADKGVFNRVSNDVHLEENVVVTSTDGTKMTTEALDWKNNEEKIYTDKPVKVTREGMDKKGAKAVTGIDGFGITPTTITCDGPMEIDYGKNSAEFNKNVKVVDERGQMLCDTATAYYDPKTRQLTKIIAKGHVKIIRGGSWTFSDEAEYLAQEQKIVLTGSPKVMIYPEEAKAANTK